MSDSAGSPTGAARSLRDLFDQAVELSADARERFVAALESAGSPHCAQLRRLLASADPSAESPLDADPWARIEEEGPEPAPERIGPYRILSELGRGGMGRVYLAESLGADFDRQVALKVVAPGGSGVGEIERRFREERRILARLEHPGIARLYDAGRAEDGRWYLALEYVAGTNLIDHVRQHGLEIAERLRLFLAVLEAVAYAHAASVVHRDLKPANIQVGRDGRPRLLDFGIAKFLAGGAAETAPGIAVTRTGTRALTPAYASPEQFRGTTATPASDVFSLGVVLYELLADVRPFQPQGTEAEIERAILGEDPEPPSTARRRAQTATGRAVGQPSSGRSAARRLPRDLDAICLKALQKRPEDRYASAAGFAVDIERYLAGAPVAARGGGLGYRLSRFYRRHRPAVAAAAVLGLLVTALGYSEVARRRVALAAGAGATALAIEPTPRTFPFSGVAASDVPELERRFAAEPGSVETGAHLVLALAKGDRRAEAELIVARLRQIPGRGADPLIDYAEATLAGSGAAPQRALVLFSTALERALSSGRGDLVSQTRASRGRLLSTLGRSEEARADMEAARTGFETSGDTASLARVLNDLAIEELQRGNLLAGERLLEQALAASRATGPGGGGVILGNLAGIAMQRGRPDLAEPRHREAVQIFRQAKSRRLSWALTDLSETLRDLGKVAEGDAALAEALTLLAAGPAGSDYAIALLYRGGAELDAGKLSEVETTAAEIQRVARATGERPGLAFAGRLLGQVAGARGELAAARRELGDSSRLLRENGQEDWAAESDLALAEIEFRAGELVRAAKLADRVAVSESTAGYVATALLAGIDARLDRVPEAQRRLEALGSAGAGSPSVDRQVSYLLARARWARAAGREAEAGQDYATALASAEAAGHKLLGDEIRAEAAVRTERPAQGTAAGQ
jgi:tetratricopeptide (TPR) repeat protein